MYKYLKYFFKLSKGSTGGRASNIGLEWRNQSSLQGFISKVPWDMLREMWTFELDSKPMVASHTHFHQNTTQHISCIISQFVISYRYFHLKY